MTFEGWVWCVWKKEPTWSLLLTINNFVWTTEIKVLMPASKLFLWTLFCLFAQTLDFCPAFNRRPAPMKVQRGWRAEKKEVNLIWFDCKMINIYWNMAHDGNVNHLEEIPHLWLIQFGRLRRYLISAENWFSLMKLGRHPSNILSPGGTVIPQPPLAQRMAPSSLEFCRRAARCWASEDVWDGEGPLAMVINQSWHLDENEPQCRRARLTNNEEAASAIVQWQILIPGLKCLA